MAGIDFYPSAIAHCRSLFAKAGASGTFFVGDVFDARDLLPGQYDLVYASIGAINWIPSIRDWLSVAASLLKPGGRLHLRDVHPMAMAFDPKVDGRSRCSRGVCYASSQAYRMPAMGLLLATSSRGDLRRAALGMRRNECA